MRNVVVGQLMVRSGLVLVGAVVWLEVAPVLWSHAERWSAEQWFTYGPFSALVLLVAVLAGRTLARALRVLHGPGDEPADLPSGAVATGSSQNGRT